MALVITLLIICLTPAPLFSQARPEPKKSALAAGSEFSYESKDRRDPFEPLFLAKLKQRQSSWTQSKEGYELEELKLVGVLKSGGTKFAMMEDMQGKGMLFKEGDHVNKTMWLMDVGDEKITVAYRIKGDVRKIAIDIPRK